MTFGTLFLLPAGARVVLVQGPEVGTVLCLRPADARDALYAVRRAVDAAGGEWEVVAEEVEPLP